MVVVMMMLTSPTSLCRMWLRALVGGVMVGWVAGQGAGPLGPHGALRKQDTQQSQIVASRLQASAQVALVVFTIAV